MSALLNDACTEVRDVSGRVANWIARQPDVGEEFLTDWLLFEISERLRWARYKKFTRYEESRDSGADWEWWFVSKQGAIGLRVQAKKIAAGADQYSGPAYTNRRGLQIELLLEAADRENLLPFYALYYQSSQPVPIKCRGGFPAPQREGIFVAHAAELYHAFVKSGRVPVRANCLLSLSNPLACFFCCPLSANGDVADGIYRQILEYFRAPIQDAGNSNVPRPGWHDQLPARVVALLEGDQGSEHGSRERNLSDGIRPAGALLVFDFRER